MLDLTTFSLLRNVLLDTISLDLNYFESADSDLTSIDRGIRAQLLNKDSIYDRIRTIIPPFPRILIIQDELYLNTLLFMSSENETGFYSIGPFRFMPYEEKDYIQIQQQNGISMAELEFLKLLLRPLPKNISISTAIAIARNIICATSNEENPPVEQTRLSFIPSEKPSMLLKENINTQARRIEEIYQHEEKLLKAVSEGNECDSLREAQFFIHLNMYQRFQPYLDSQRQLMYSVNTLFRKTAQANGIHPLTIDEISQNFAQKIMLCSTRQQLDEINFEMIHDYCELCRDHSTENYSDNVQKIIHYIHLNLRDNLTLDSIAKAINFSPNYVSRLFKAEVGVSLVNYIASQRISVSQKLLKETTMTIREIAVYIGIPDWNYFTKIFKKNVGCTPKEYRQKNNLAKKIK